MKWESGGLVPLLMLFNLGAFGFVIFVSGCCLCGRLFPADEVAVGIAGAAVEGASLRFAFAGLAAYELASPALWALDAGGLYYIARISAVRISGAGDELAEASPLNQKGFAALRAILANLLNGRRHSLRRLRHFI